MSYRTGFHFKVVKGVRTLNTPGKYQEYYTNLKDGEYLQPFPELVNDERSEAANDYYFGAIVDGVVQLTSNTKEAVHKFFKDECNDGMSTQGMSVRSFYLFTERCKKWCWDFLELIIPDPPDKIKGE